MNTEIKNRFTGEVIVEAGKYASIREAVEKKRADLQGADLRGADLRGADLQGAGLQGADLQGAGLQGADLRGADLQGAYLQGAYLQRADGAQITLLRNNAILCIGPIGSRQAYLTAYNTDKGIYVMAGCYFNKIEAFKEAVNKKHKNTKHAHDYLTAIAFIKAVMRSDIK